MPDVKVDHCIRLETVLGIKFGPEIEMVLTAEYDGAEFELTELECDGVVMTVSDKHRSTEQHVLWDRSQYDLLHNDELRCRAFNKHAEQAFETA